MSALPLEADIDHAQLDVGLRPKADMRRIYCDAPAVSLTAFESLAGTVSMTSNSCHPGLDLYRYFGGFSDVRWNV